MSSDTSTGEKVSTGIPGLDHVLGGGFLREGFYLRQGAPGSGKTTAALQYVLGRVKAGERCLYITLTESRRDLENACRSHGWSLEGLELCDLTKSAANLANETEVQRSSIEWVPYARPDDLDRCTHRPAFRGRGGNRTGG
jgi:circadian clock protein KaiC